MTSTLAKNPIERACTPPILAEHMVRLWKQRDKERSVREMRDNFHYELATGQCLLHFGPGPSLEGFVTWWRTTEEVAGLLNQGGVGELPEMRLPPLETVTMPEPECIIVRFLCSPKDKRVTDFLHKRFAEITADCPVYYARRNGQWKRWEMQRNGL